LYSKGALTIIAILLAVIVAKQYVSPDAVQAQGPFTGIQFTGYEWGAGFFDPRTGDVREYNAFGQLAEHYRLTKPGQNMVREK